MVGPAGGVHVASPARVTERANMPSDDRMTEAERACRASPTPENQRRLADERRRRGICQRCGVARAPKYSVICDPCFVTQLGKDMALAFGVVVKGAPL